MIAFSGVALQVSTSATSTLRLAPSGATQVDALPCGSKSRRQVSPCRARLAARVTLIVVFPTPPFMFAKHIVFIVFFPLFISDI